MAASNRFSKPQNQRPCNFFLRTGTCRFGSDCRFSHEGGSAIFESRSSHPAANPEAERERTQYLEWKRLLRRQPSHLDNRSVLADFWSQALAIVETSTVDHRQMLVKDLTDDQYEGCLYLIRTLEMRLHVRWDDARSVTRNMLKLITHYKILDCLSIDTPVGTMYSVISGSNGSRVVPFFISFCTNLESSCQRRDIPMRELTECAQLVLDATHEVLSREKRVAFCEDLPALFDQLDVVISFLDTANDRRMKNERVCVLKRVALLSTGRLTTVTNGGQEPSTGMAANAPSVYPRELKLPGTRHDNDRLNIVDISILPTVGELTCDQVDFLPSTDFRHSHFLHDPVQRYLDTHFRLLRHDVFGPLKDVLGALIPSVARNGVPLISRSFDANVHLYHNSSISHVSVDQKRGFEVHISFTPPKMLHKKTAKERHLWWASAKRLEVGSLLYLVFAADDSVVLLTFTVSDKSVDGPPEHNLLSATSPSFKAKLAMQGPRDIEDTLRMYTDKGRGVLVELPGLIPATFSPVLENLKRMTTMGWLPFQEWIIPKPEEPPNRTRSLEPPRYARAPGFSFPLDAIAAGEGPPLSLSATCSQNDTALINDLESRLTLDRGQCQALVAALTQEFSLIQGPPGTGKSYLGVQLIRVLLSCKEKASLGPIVIFCYTNHALDQFLMHLKDVGITKFIRIGGQSRAAQIDGHNLRNVSAGALKTRHESYLLGSTYSSLEEGMKKMGGSLATLHQLRKGSLSALEQFLQRKHRRIYSQFFEEDAQGFTRVGKDPIGSWLSSAPDTAFVPTPGTLSEEELQTTLRQANRDVDSISLRCRHQLVDSWLNELRQDRIELLHENIVETEALRATINTVHNEVNRRTLADADVIGITTTGMARDVSLLRGLRSKVVLCEEAGEVLEAHVISALMPSVEHFIQIGDHRQLRPTINNWSTLSLESTRGQDYQLDRSQFERLALGQPGLPPIPLSQLNIQRRMRPDIADLLRRTMYPNLEDHQSIRDLPNVVGMRQNLFWLTHSHLEDAGGDDGRLKSQSNKWEVKMVQALVRHIVRQGVYKSEDIAVLTPYTGNLQKLRASLSSDFEITMSDRDEEAMAKDGFASYDTEESQLAVTSTIRKERLVECLRLATVDNFQGEEAKVIIVSLVRSNTQKKVGFLRTVNRINVLLSGAQHGMYLVGNVDTYSNIPMWNDVREQLEAAGCIGPALELCCPRHPGTAIRCSEPEDFSRVSPEGGCSLACDHRLARCGHKCQAKCHSETMHDAFLCPQPCPRRHEPCGHGCDKLCGEDCGKCMVSMRNVLLPCGHFVDDIPCHQAQQPSKITCRVKVEKKVAGCQHIVKVFCPVDVNTDNYRCPAKCDALLPDCGHSCSGTCGECRKEKDGKVKVVHLPCKVTCKRPRNTCGHICRRGCHPGNPCGPCESRCEGHCQVCKQKLDSRVDLLEFRTYEEIDLDESPVVALTCGHFFTAESLDGLVNIAAVYTVDKAGKYNGIKEPSEVLALPSCPDCKQPIRQFATQRYNRIINMAVMDETSKKFQMKGEAKLKKLEEATDAVETTLEASGADLVKQRPDSNVVAFKVAGALLSYHSRYGRCTELRKEIQGFCKEASNEQQPAKKLADAIVHSKKLRRSQVSTSLDEDMEKLHLGDTVLSAPAFNQQITLGARMAQLRIDDVILRDQLRLVGAGLSGGTVWPKGRDPTHLARLFLRESDSFIDDCQASRLPRLAVQASIAFARIVGYLGNHPNHPERTGNDIVEKTGKRLDGAAQMCEAGFEGAAELLIAVKSLQRLFEKERYEIVTPDELASIKAAMLED
ncbi:P-loop containing nucleoside triphosphate hydrolase protein [Apiospora aurea]|uniref:P-loop containing nucleoside triphosphate hydrolase protein n=1 Tax=Apiospora aurea TaxID=335848 RepID=A0ABR1QPA4_9PEZI